MNKAVLHDHLDGGLRAITAKELAIKDSYKPLLDVDDIESFFNRESSESLEDYLEAFAHTTALMSSYENLERIFWKWHEFVKQALKDRMTRKYQVINVLSLSKIRLHFNRWKNHTTVQIVSHSSLGVKYEPPYCNSLRIDVQF